MVLRKQQNHWHYDRHLQGIVGGVGVRLVHDGPRALAHGHGLRGQLHQALVHSWRGDGQVRGVI